MTVKTPAWNALATNGRPPADTLVLLVGAAVREKGEKGSRVGDDVISNPRELEIDDGVGVAASWFFASEAADGDWVGEDVGPKVRYVSEVGVGVGAFEKL